MRSSGGVVVGIPERFAISERGWAGVCKNHDLGILWSKGHINEGSPLANKPRLPLGLQASRKQAVPAQRLMETRTVSRQ